MNRLESLMTAGLRVLLVGPPGIAKTARIRAAALATGRRLVTMRASLSERIDFGGCLVPDQDAGVTRALPLETLKNLRNAAEPTLLFLDDLGQAPVDVQAACMRLFDEGELSDQILIWGATNRPADKAGVSALCEPLRSRFQCAFSIPTPGQSETAKEGAVSLGTWEETVESWCQWALSIGAPAEVIAWHRMTIGRTLYAWKPHSDPAMRLADFRTWEASIRLWNAGLRDFETQAAAVGKPVASEFLAFAALADKLPTPQQVRMDPTGAPVPDDASGQWLVSTSLSTAVEPAWVGAMITYIQRLPRVMAALCAKDAYRKLGAKLCANPDWQRWFVENQELFA